jgi:hypothetical protein
MVTEKASAYSHQLGSAWLTRRIRGLRMQKDEYALTNEQVQQQRWRSQARIAALLPERTKPQHVTRTSRSVHEIAR